MTIFGSSKKIYKEDFKQALKKASSISKQERSYLNDVFKGDLSNGLSVYEIKKRIAKLRYNSNDCLDRNEVEQVKKKLLERF